MIHLLRTLFVVACVVLVFVALGCAWFDDPGE